MRDTNFKVGDRVRVLTVKQMKKEFGSTSRCRCGFVSEMHKFCGRELTIRSLEEEGKDKNGNKNWFVRFEEDDLEGWAWSTDMIEKVEGKEMPKYKVGDKVILRTYDDLAKEYGKDKSGCIKTPITINSGMGLFVKEYGGKEITVGYVGNSVEFQEDDTGYSWHPCVILRKVDEDKPMPEGGKPVGVIKSLDDVRAIMKGKEKCSDTPCANCAITKRLGAVDCKQAQLDAYQFCINCVEGKGAEAPKPEKKVTRKPLGSGKCKDCVHKEPLAGGYYFCKKWYNVTLEDGYCHYYEKLEKKKKEVEEE